jgi:hypothetical protein
VGRRTGNPSTGNRVIELRRPPVSAAADAVASRLADLVVAHRIVEDGSLPGPVLVDGSLTAFGPEEIESFLATLSRDLDDWGRFQTDACYLDEDGRVC